MDEIKLTAWRERFEIALNNMQTEYNAFFLNKRLQDIYSIRLDVSAEWELQVKDDVPTEIKSRLQQLFLTAKPEDSI